MTDSTLSLTATSVPAEPMVSGDNDDWEHDTWDVTLHFQGRTMSLKFHMGIGNRRNGTPVAPSIGDVLSSVASDATGVLDGQSFEDWASGYGYDTDSRKAERTYKAVLAQAAELRTLLGDEYLDVVAFHAPDDGDWSEFRGDSIELPARDDDDEQTYKIVRFRQQGDNEVIVTGLTLDDAQEHCNRDDTHGDGWFDGYTAE